MWDRDQWDKLEAAACSGMEAIHELSPKDKLLQKYRTLLKSGRAGCIGYGYRKILNDIGCLASFYQRQGFVIEEVVEDEDAHVLSMSRPLCAIKRSLVQRYSLCPRLHVDFLPLTADKADVWAIPHIDPHDPSEEPRLHEVDRSRRVYAPPSPGVKAILKLILSGREPKNVVSPLFIQCMMPLGITI
ncbi:MAG: hypothetical protein QF415_14100 [Candidatus Undinarchaeales archaeon]|jgi:hypothetical protein|nr:hypothetical protein [Candidatus Undinarchaeales archaeon]MDP7493895.1 hypothetical protein [Candidatus Undinarchaeales archaeon]